MSKEIEYSEGAPINIKRSVTTEPWFPDRACRRSDPKLFVSNYKKDSEKARAICQTCPVRVGCLNFAIAEKEVGVWGGTTEIERSQLSKTLISIQRLAQSPASASPTEISVFPNQNDKPSPPEAKKRKKRSPAEIELVRSGIKELKLVGFTDTQIAEILGLSVHYVKNNVKLLIRNGSLESRGRLKKDVEDTDAQVAKLRRLGKPNKQIALELNITRARVRESTKRLFKANKIKQRNNVRARWARIDKMVLAARNQETELTNAQIAELLNLSFGTLKQSLERLSKKGKLIKRRA